MKREIVKCKVDGKTVNKEAKCPDYTCDDCPFDNEKRSSKPTASSSETTRYFQFTEAERKVFAKGNFRLAQEIYYFLQEFIENHKEDEIREFYWSYEKFKKYLPHCSHETERLYSLSLLISRHCNQRKNIPLDCFLYGLKRIDPEDIQGAKELLKRASNQDDAEVLIQDAQHLLDGRYKRGFNLSSALQKRQQRARNTKYIKEIYHLAFLMIHL
jgi:hypothetical protein